jgi:hypothetical protein
MHQRLRWLINIFLFLGIIVGNMLAAAVPLKQNPPRIEQNQNGTIEKTTQGYPFNRSNVIAARVSQK